jgi:hypothetical protein
MHRRAPLALSLISSAIVQAAVPRVPLKIFTDLALTSQQHPARVADQTMIGRASALPDLLPELRRYLLEYPNAELAGADSFFLPGEAVVRTEAHDSGQSRRHLSRPLAGPRFGRRHDQVAVPDALLPYRAGHQVVRAAPCPVLTVHPANRDV